MRAYHVVVPARQGLSLSLCNTMAKVRYASYELIMNNDFANQAITHGIFYVKTVHVVDNVIAISQT